MHKCTALNIFLPTLNPFLCFLHSTIPLGVRKIGRRWGLPWWQPCGCAQPNRFSGGTEGGMNSLLLYWLLLFFSGRPRHYRLPWLISWEAFVGSSWASLWRSYSYGLHAALAVFLRVKVIWRIMIVLGLFLSVQIKLTIGIKSRSGSLRDMWLTISTILPERSNRK